MVIAMLAMTDAGHDAEKCIKFHKLLCVLSQVHCLYYPLVSNYPGFKSVGVNG